MLALDHYYENCPALAVDAGPNATGFSKPQELNLNQHSDPSLLCRAGLSRRGKGCDSKIRPVTVLGWGDLPFDQQVCVNRQHPAPVGQGGGFGSPGTCDRE
jgi:hypothetical protein